MYDGDRAGGGGERLPGAGGLHAPADPAGAALGELAAGEIAGRFPISGPSISRHLGVLKGAGLVRERRDANRILYSLVEERLALCVGRFLSAVCPEEFLARGHRRRAGERRPE